MTQTSLTTLALLLAAAGTSGCITMDIRVACTLAKDELVAITQVGPLRIAGAVNDKDRAVACRQ